MKLPRKGGQSPKLPNKKNLTEATAMKTKPKSSPFNIWDTEQKGLALQISASGHRSYR